MSWQPLAVLLTCLFVCSSTAMADIAYLEIPYSGGGPLCDESECESGLYCMPSFDCDTSSTWNNGTRTFADPTPGPVNITTISAIVAGVFGCQHNSTKPLFLHLYLQNAYLGALQIYIPEHNNCSCLNCATGYPWNRYVSGWPSYNFNGENSIQVFGDDVSACVSAVTLMISYDAPPPLPSTSSAASTSSTSSTATSSSATSGGSATMTSTTGTTFNSTTTTGGPPTDTHELVVVGAVMLGGMVFVNMCLVGGWYALRRKNDSDGDSEGGVPSSPIDSSALDKTLLYTDLVVGERIGRGSFGEVYSGIWFRTQVAIKKLPMEMLRSNASVLEEFTKEINLLKSLRHPNILQFLGACTIPPDICLVTEFMPKGDLHKIIHDRSVVLDKQLMKRIGLDIARGMLYLHSSNPVIIHRDLKSHNVLIGEHWNAKVADFGLSKIIQTWEENAKYTPCGTPKWAAPEVLRNDTYTTKADVYSFAIILWEMSTRLDPFPNMSAFELIVQVGKHGLRPGALSDLNPLAHIIAECWEDNPKLRPSFERIISLLDSW